MSKPLGNLMHHSHSHHDRDGVSPAGNIVTRPPSSDTDGMVRAADRGRFFAHGDLRLVILHLIAEKPRHGYEIIKAIEERVGGAYSPSPGVDLSDPDPARGARPCDGQRRRRRQEAHAITAEGRAYLDAYRPAVDALLARMAGGRARPWRRSCAADRARDGELKLALRLRLVTRPAQRGANQRRGCRHRRRGHQRGTDLMFY